MNDIKMTGFDLETFDRIKKNISDLLPSSPNDDDTTKSPTNVELYNQIYGNRDISDGAKGNKISALRRGDGISLNDIIKIAAWKSLSLDWLILGKGNPPPELQSSPAEKVTIRKNSAPSNTVRGFLRSLAYLSIAEYTQDMKIEVKSFNYFHHIVNISFCIEPLSKNNGDKSNPWQCDTVPWQCDTVTSLILGLRKLSEFGLLNLPNDNGKNSTVKITACKHVLDEIPYWQNLIIYQRGYPFACNGLYFGGYLQRPFYSRKLRY